ncbi:MULTISPECIES: hypothetical protein [Bacillus]|uniref:Uncharacterized protein n=2 Tax=Bacillus cereus group TaxID=86661 RepID=A0A0B5SA88_BACMY|nr:MULTISPECIES: hypothetical protein [Bacillus]AJH18309.1 hypothetical protein BG05_2770 [Bacillus mycoides]EEL96290.1 hypothetical protein bmyco0001_52840 [Bacillus mycoides DSM 2048]EJQ59988.1 hypothetical protein IEW_02975 [Bacillus mycoides]EJQ65496.1 hypothetical protein IEY_02356 [Bacillus mycoides]EJR41833.1 hypothetical protein III_02260 [Bacillus mycoides]
MHNPFLIYHSPYNDHQYIKMIINPMYMEVSSAVVPLQVQQSMVHTHPILFGPSFYENPYFKHFHYNVKAQVWEG